MIAIVIKLQKLNLKLLSFLLTSLPSKIIRPKTIITNPINSEKVIICCNTIAFNKIANGGIITVQINKLPAPVLSKILKYKKYAKTEQIMANKKAYIKIEKLILNNSFE